MRKELLIILYLLFFGVFTFSQENNKIIYANIPYSAIEFVNDDRITISTRDLMTGAYAERKGVYNTSIKHGGLPPVKWTES